MHRSINDHSDLTAIEYCLVAGLYAAVIVAAIAAVASFFI
jgi:Flp pilus assembly pilin Flp